YFKSNSIHMKLIQYIFLLLGILVSTNSFCQSGKIQGIIIEESTNEPAIGVRISVENSTFGTISDFDGKFEIDIKPGNYTVIFSSIAYDTVRLTNIHVHANQTKHLNTIKVVEKTIQVEEVTISATRRVDSEIAVLVL